jgi:ribosomal-protein-alanine N-acetyltransferase
MLIRAAIPEDIPHIMSLAQQSETAAHWSGREYDALFAPEAPVRVALVAISETPSGVVAGFVIVRCAEDEWEIENVVVEPELRRHGIGRRLIESVLRKARKNAAIAIVLEVRESNAAARSLYANLGFKEEGRRRAYYHNPEEDALVLRMPL